MLLLLRNFPFVFALWLLGGLLQQSAFVPLERSSAATQARTATPDQEIDPAADRLARSNRKSRKTLPYAYTAESGPSLLSKVCTRPYDYGEALPFSPPAPSTPCPVLIPALFLLARPIPSHRPARNTATIPPILPRSQEGKYHYARLPRTCSKSTAYAHDDAQNLDRIAIWPSRDPIEEEGGLNLYGFVENNSIGYIDIKGRFPFPGASSFLLWLLEDGEKLKRWSCLCFQAKVECKCCEGEGKKESCGFVEELLGLGRGSFRWEAKFKAQAKVTLAAFRDCLKLECPIEKGGFCRPTDLKPDCACEENRPDGRGGFLPPLPQIGPVPLPDDGLIPDAEFVDPSELEPDQPDIPGPNRGGL